MPIWACALRASSVMKWCHEKGQPRGWPFSWWPTVVWHGGWTCGNQGARQVGTPVLNLSPYAPGKDTFPRLAGQHANYMMKQLHILSETNQRPAGAMM